VISYELRVGKVPAARACGETAAQKSAARKKELCACLFPMGMPAKISIILLKQSSYDRRFGLAFQDVILENHAVWPIKVTR
jgi:hypothetical protein